MVTLISKIGFRGFGNVLVQGQRISYIEENAVQSMDNFKLHWTYEYTASPYWLHGFDKYILFQEKDEKEIVVLDWNGQRKMTLPGRYYLFGSVAGDGHLLLRERDGDEWRWVKLYKDLHLEPSGVEGAIGNISIYRRFLIDRFTLLTCWDMEKKVCVWQRDMTRYRIYRQFSQEVDGGVRAVYFEEDIVIAVCHEYLMAFNLTTGAPLWNKHFPACGFYDWGFVNNGILFILGGSGHFRKIDIKTGDILLETRQELKCTHPVNGRATSLWSFHLTNVVDTGRYMAGSTKLHTFFFLIDKESGELADMGRLVEEYPEVRDPILFMDGKLYVLYMYRDRKELMAFNIDQ
jgi:hypothetical protein